MRDSMVFYRSFHEATKELPPKVYKELLTAVFNYALDGTEGKLSPAANTAFQLIKPQIDANNKRYENGCKGGEFGYLGGRPKKTPKKPQKNPTQTPNDNENENENVNEILTRTHARKNSFNNFAQNDIDFKELSKKVFAN